LRDVGLEAREGQRVVDGAWWRLVDDELELALTGRDDDGDLLKPGEFGVDLPIAIAIAISVVGDRSDRQEQPGGCE